MLVPLHYFHRFSALSMAVFGLYIFTLGVHMNEYKMLDDGTFIDTSKNHLMTFKNSQTILTFKTGFDMYRSISYGLSGLFLLIDLFLGSGYLSLPALVLTGGELLRDFSDFCLAVILISVYVGGYSGAAYGLMYFALLLFEMTIWLGTCKFHESCRFPVKSAAGKPAAAVSQAEVQAQASSPMTKKEDPDKGEKERDDERGDDEDEIPRKESQNEVRKPSIIPSKESQSLKVS